MKLERNAVVESCIVVRRTAAPITWSRAAIIGGMNWVEDRRLRIAPPQNSTVNTRYLFLHFGGTTGKAERHFAHNRRYLCSSF